MRVDEMSGQIVFLGSLDPRLHPPPSPKTGVKYKVEAVAGNEARVWHVISQHFKVHALIPAHSFAPRYSVKFY